MTNQNDGMPVEVIDGRNIPDSELFANHNGNGQEPEQKGDDKGKDEVVTLSKKEHETLLKRISDTQAAFHQQAGEIKALREHKLTQQPTEPAPRKSDALLQKAQNSGDAEDFAKYLQVREQELKDEILRAQQDPTSPAAIERKMNEQKALYSARHPQDSDHETFFEKATQIKELTYEDMVWLGKVRDVGGWEKLVQADSDRLRIPGKPDNAKGGNNKPLSNTTPNPNDMLARFRKREGF